MLKNKKAFTLIELLIVIGIISILAGIVLVAVNPAEQFGKANDAERKSELSMILSAVFQFQTSPSARGSLPECDYNATPDTLPLPLCGANYDGAFPIATLGTTGSAIVMNCDDDLIPSYLREIPLDPSLATTSTSSEYYICREVDGTTGVTTVTVLAPKVEVYNSSDDVTCTMACDDNDTDNIYNCGTAASTVDAMCISG